MESATQTDAVASKTDAPDAISGPKTLTVRETAEALGISVDAVRSRLDRKTLPYVKRRDGKRAVPVHAVRAAAASLRDAGSMQTDAAASTVQTTDAIDLIERLTERCIDAERRAANIEAQKLLTERSEASAVEALHEARVRVSALEEQLAEMSARRRWWRGRRT